MEHIIKGVLDFQQSAYQERKELFHSLANTQSPEVLFITCADSRIDPSLITQSNPGDLFVCRNAGNVVPPHSAPTNGMTASIEYAVAALGVKHIVVCGHSNCGAMKGALAPEALASVPNVADWLGHCRSAVEVIKERHQCTDAEHLDELIEENVLLQIRHLKTHPAVLAKHATSKVQIHGWVYNIETGGVNCYSDEKQAFVPFEERFATEISDL